MLILRVFFVSCFMCVCCFVQCMNCNSVEFIRFLSSRHYLDGSRNVSPQDKDFITDCVNKFSSDNIFSDTTLHSFVDNIAFVIAQIGQLDYATQILIRSYKEYQNDDNWLFEEIKQNGEKITPETVKESLANAYNLGS